MAYSVAEKATRCKPFSSRIGGFTGAESAGYVAGMVTKPQKAQKPRKGEAHRPERPKGQQHPAEAVVPVYRGRQPHLYVEEHMAAKHLDVPTLASRLDQHEKSVYRALREPSRIWKEVWAWADAIGLDDWRDLTMPPSHPSVDKVIVRSLTNTKP